MRTIRGIENGHNHAPHVSTMLALAKGLDLGPDDAARLVGSVRNIKSLRSFGEMAADGVDLEAALAEAQLQANSAHRIVSFNRHAFVGPNRRIHRVDNEILVEALIGGHDRHLAVHAGDQAEDARFLHFTRLDGCRLLSRHLIPDQNRAVFELSLGSPLREGETRLFRYSAEVGQEPPEDPEEARIWTALEPSDGSTHGFTRPVSTHVFKVTFEGCAPTRLWELRGVKVAERIGELTLDEFGSTHISGQNREPSNYGIEWAWD